MSAGHYCTLHQGNASHYAEENCDECRSTKTLKELRDQLHTANQQYIDAREALTRANIEYNELHNKWLIEFNEQKEKLRVADALIHEIETEHAETIKAANATILEQKNRLDDYAATVIKGLYKEPINSQRDCINAALETWISSASRSQSGVPDSVVRRTCMKASLARALRELAGSIEA